jgi:anti-sigma regulatory factor (Ser/Thr protein kinase)
MDDETDPCTAVLSESAMETMVVEDAWCTEIGGDPGAPATARELLTERLGEHTPAGTLHDLHLLTTELVTNAVLHARADTIVMQVAAHPARVRVSVTDPGSSEHVPEVQPLAPDATGGMGLFLVEQISSSWGVERTPDGANRVWFELAA